MKKLLILPIAFILALCAVIPMVAHSENYIVTTEKTTLNMRTAPQGEILPGGIPKDTVINVFYTVQYKGCTWAVTEYNGQHVYLFAEGCGVRYLTKASDVNNTSTATDEQKKSGSDIEVLDGLDPTKEYEGQLFQVNTIKGPLNVRRGPGRSHKISVRLIPGSYVEVIKIEGKWAKVHYKTGKVGWVMLEYIVPVNVAT